MGPKKVDKSFSAEKLVDEEGMETWRLTWLANPAIFVVSLDLKRGELELRRKINQHESLARQLTALKRLEEDENPSDSSRTLASLNLPFRFLRAPQPRSYWLARRTGRRV